MRSEALFGDARLLNTLELLEHLVYAAMSAAWFWHRAGLNSQADKGDFLTITKRINGLADREEFYQRALKVLRLAPGACPRRLGGLGLASQPLRQAIGEQAESYGREREQAAVAVIDWQESQQIERRALEERLQVSDEAHYREFSDAQKNISRLRDRIATADVRLSVLLAAPSGGGGLSTAARAGSVVHGGARPNLTQRLLSELSLSPETGTRD